MAKKATKEMTRVYFMGVEDIGTLNTRLMEYMSDENMSDEMLMNITEEFDRVYLILKDEHNKKAEEWQKMYGNPKSTRETISALLANADLLNDCDIMIVGSWVWVKGKPDKDKSITKNYREFLNGIKGFRYNTERNLWQWHLDEGKPWYPHRRKGEKLMSEDRVFKKYGMTFATEEEE